MDQSIVITLITTVLGGIGAAGTWAGKFIMKALDECKGEHAKALVKIEELHVELKDVSRAVGKLEGRLTSYQEQNPNNSVDNSEGSA